MCVWRDNRRLRGCTLETQYSLKIPIFPFFSKTLELFHTAHTGFGIRVLLRFPRVLRGFLPTQPLPSIFLDLSSGTRPKDDILDSRDDGSYYFVSYVAGKDPANRVNPANSLSSGPDVAADPT